MKKVFIAISIIVVTGLVYGAGWKMKDIHTQNQIKASLIPADKVIKETVAGTNLDRTYGDTSKIYKQSESSATFTSTLLPLKGAEVTNNKFYIGALENQSIYELTKDSKDYALIVGTTKEDGKWVISSLFVTADN